MALRIVVFGVLGCPVILAATGLIMGGTSLLIDVWHCHRPRQELLERLARFQPPSPLADEVHRWLQSQR